MKINNTLKFIITIAVSELAGIIGSVFTMPSIPTWYAGLIKPTLNPPAWIFGPLLAPTPNAYVLPLRFEK